MQRRLAVFLCAMALVAPACGTQAPSGQRSGRNDDVKVGLISILDVAPIYLGKQKGFFAKRHINLTLQPAEGGTETVPSVLSGNQQFGFSNIVTLLLARAKGLPVKAVTNGVNSTGADGDDFGALMVRRDSPIRTVRDLAGKRVAVNTFKNVVELAVRASVKKAGVDEDSIHYVKLDFPEMPAALAAGRADAVFVVEPFQQVVLAQGGRRLASSYVDTAADMCVAMYFTSRQLESQDPDLVKRFTAAMNESLAYASGHPDEVRRILPTYTKIPAEVIPRLVLPRWPTTINRDSVAAVSAFAREQGIVPSEPDLDALLP